MQKYRKKPGPEFEAAQVTEEEAEKIAYWCNGKITKNKDGEFEAIRIPAANNPGMSNLVQAGDYILRGPDDGLFYPVTSLQFEETFEEIK